MHVWPWAPEHLGYGRLIRGVSCPGRASPLLRLCFGVTQSPGRKAPSQISMTVRPPRLADRGAGRGDDAEDLYPPRRERGAEVESRGRRQVRGRGRPRPRRAIPLCRAVRAGTVCRGISTLD